MSHFADLVFDPGNFDIQDYFSADTGEDWEGEPKLGRRYPYLSLASIPLWDSNHLLHHWVECLGCNIINRIRVEYGPMGEGFPREHRGYQRFYCPNCGKFNGRYRSDNPDVERIDSFELPTGQRLLEAEQKSFDERYRQETITNILSNYQSRVETSGHRYKRHPEEGLRLFLNTLLDVRQAASGPIEELPPLVLIR